MQTISPKTQCDQEFCQLDIFADDNLLFNVRVTCNGKSFIAGGFRNPDQAQRRGMHALLAMSGMPLESERARALEPALVQA